MNDGIIQPDDHDKQVICPVCHNMNPSQNHYCMFCGSSLQGAALEPNSKTLEKTCPKCGRLFPENIKFCYYDGTTLQLRGDVDVIIDHSHASSKPIVNQFNGFGVALNSSYTHIPLELLRSSTDLLIPSPKAPSDAKVLATSGFFSISAPKPKYTFLQKIRTQGFSEINITRYFVSWLFIAATLVLWASKSLTVMDYQTNPWLIIVIIIWTTAITVVFLAPILFIGRLMAKLQSPMEYEISILNLSIYLILNYFLLEFLFPFPIIWIFGDVKTKITPTKKELGTAVFKGIIISQLVCIIGGISVFLVTQPELYGNTTIQLAAGIFKLGFFMTALALTFIMIPTGNLLGKVIFQTRQKYYLVLAVITVIMLSYSLILLSIS